jgi:hypothetical protein
LRDRRLRDRCLDRAGRLTAARGQPQETHGQYGMGVAPLVLGILVVTGWRLRSRE